eukprot:3107454-Prymnesium_polylepis.1
MPGPWTGGSVCRWAGRRRWRCWGAPRRMRMAGRMLSRTRPSPRRGRARDAMPTPRVGSSEPQNSVLRSQRAGSLRGGKGSSRAFEGLQASSAASRDPCGQLEGGGEAERRCGGSGIGLLGCGADRLHSCTDRRSGAREGRCAARQG